MMMTGMMAKEFTGNEDKVKIYKGFLSHNYPLFMESYLQWLEVTKFDPASLTLLNIRAIFEELFNNTEESDEIRFTADTKQDYNYIVDYIF